MQNRGKEREKQNKCALLIQRNWRRYYERKRYLRLLKRQKKKMFIAQELLNSERAYCEQIGFVIRQIMIPTQAPLLDHQMHEYLFSNIEQIYQLHNAFLTSLEETMKGFHPQTGRLSHPLLTALFNKEEFKQAYTQYCFNYKKTDQVIKILVDNNLAFVLLLRKLGISSLSLSLESYMIKPVQRLCKYGLMVDDYFKNTEIDHPDYANLNQANELIQKLVHETNDQVEEFLMRERYKELKCYYPTYFAKLPLVKRRLYYESKDITLFSVIKEQSLEFRSLLLFSDCILLLSRIQEDPLYMSYTFARQLQNFKYYRFMVQLVDKFKYSYIQFRDQKDRRDFMEIMEKKIGTLESEAYRGFVRVSILGTQNRESFFSSYTVYIIQIDRKGQTTTIYPRFKDLLKVQDFMLDRGMKFQTPLLFKQSPYLTLKSKTIEKRKLTIQQFLERVLNGGESSEISEVEQILGIGKALKGRQKTLNQMEQISIILPNLQKIKVALPVRSSKIKDLKFLISMQIGLEEGAQFEIFQTRNKCFTNKKLLYEDEPALKIYEEQRQSATSLNPFRDTIQYLYTRHYYLPRQQEQDMYKYDSVRAELELAVIHFQLANYRLEQDVMITFLCLFAIYIHLPIENQEKLSFYLKQLTRKQYKVSEEQFRVYYAEVLRMVTAQENLTTSVPVLAIKVVSNSYLYECQQFEVEVHHKCYAQMKKRYPTLEEKVVLGLKPDFVYFLSMKERLPLLKFQYGELKILETHPNAVVYELLNMQASLVLKTLQVFEITKLFEIYQKKK